MVRQAGGIAKRLLQAGAGQLSAAPCHAECPSQAAPRNLAAVLHGINDLRFEQHELSSSLMPGSVRVAMKAVGICGSDVHYLTHVSVLHISLL